MQKEMLDAIKADMQFTHKRIGKEHLDGRVLAAIAKVARHEFVPNSEINLAYENHPLPIGHNQTISQPYIVALMTDLITVDETSKVLEIGTGSGYQAAVLAEIVKRVYTIEIINELGEEAEQRLRRLNYNNVEVRIGDGYYGWPEQAQFDAILITATLDHVPPQLITQLKPSGRLIMPLGKQYSYQELVLITKADDETIQRRDILPVRFVPFTGNH